VTLAIPQAKADDLSLQIVRDEHTGELLATRTLVAGPDPAIPGSRRGTVLDVEAYSTAIVRSFDARAPFGPGTRGRRTGADGIGRRRAPTQRSPGSSSNAPPCRGTTARK